MKLSVRSGFAEEESDMQPAAGTVLDNLPALDPLKFGSLNRIFVCGRSSGRFSDSLGTAAEGRRGFWRMADAVAGGGGGRGCVWKDCQFSSRVGNEEQCECCVMSHYFHGYLLTCTGCTTATLCALRSRLIVASSRWGSTPLWVDEGGGGGAIFDFCLCMTPVLKLVGERRGLLTFRFDLISEVTRFERGRER